jgi:hypothetical protein
VCSSFSTSEVTSKPLVERMDLAPSITRFLRPFTAYKPQNTTQGELKWKLFLFFSSDNSSKLKIQDDGIDIYLNIFNKLYNRFENGNIKLYDSSNT